MSLASKRLFFWLLTASIALFMLFIFFSYLVHKGKFNQFDFDITVKLQDRLPRKLDLPFSILSVIGLFEVTGTIWALFLLISLINKKWLTSFSLLLMPLSLIIELYGKLFVFHPAPPLFLYRGFFDFELPKYYIHTDYSYPSGHVTRTAFLVVFLCLVIFTRVKNSFIKLTLIGGFLTFLSLMIISRIYLGEHWSTDVIGGALLGSSFGIASGLTLFFKNKTDHLEKLAI